MLTLSFYKSALAQSFCRFAFNQLCRGKESFVPGWQCNEREREGDRGRQADSKEKWHVATDGEVAPRFGECSRVDKEALRYDVHRIFGLF